MKYSFFNLAISTHSLSAILDMGSIWSFIISKLAKQLLTIIWDIEPLTIILPIGNNLVSTKAIKLDMLVNDSIYI